MRQESFDGRFPLIFTLCIAAVCVSAIVFGLPGCGKKAPPLPPHADPVPRVSDLSHEIRDSRVVLAWTVPEKVRQGVFGEGEMIVSRAKTKLTDDLCPDCPLRFQRIGVLPILRADGEPAPTYEEMVEPGFRITYKVVLQMESGRVSEPSNLAIVEY